MARRRCDRSGPRAAGVEVSVHPDALRTFTNFLSNARQQGGFHGALHRSKQHRSRRSDPISRREADRHRVGRAIYGQGVDCRGPDDKRHAVHGRRTDVRRAERLHGVHDPRRERQQHSHEGDVRKVDQLRRHLGSDQAERVIFHQSGRERRRRPSLRRRVRGLATVCRRQ